jgi:uncharacterized membrane protein
VSFNLAKGMKVVRTTPGAQDFKDRIQWVVPRLNPGETRSFNVAVQAAAAGTVPSFAQVLWRGPEQRAEVVTEFLGAAALHLDLRESGDPIRVGDKVRYTITVTNRGNAPAKDVKLVIKYPITQFAVDLEGTDGKSLPDKSVEITLPPIGPKDQTTRQVTLKATHAGKAVFHVEMESQESLPAGNVTREEPTTITD